MPPLPPALPKYLITDTQDTRVDDAVMVANLTTEANSEQEDWEEAKQANEDEEAATRQPVGK